MTLNVEHLNRTIDTLEQALEAIGPYRTSPDSVLFDLYRNAAIKSFELSLETAGKLLRKALKLFEASPRSVDAWVFNDVLRHAGKNGLLTTAEVERWLTYRANRNSTAHDYGKGFANETLKLLPTYIEDVRALAKQMQRVFDATA
jgi:nucleotidyltransferase substrate binding protein (TIGR01987 family)